jgi:hypothetical protein
MGELEAHDIAEDYNAGTLFFEMKQLLAEET